MSYVMLDWSLYFLTVNFASSLYSDCFIYTFNHSFIGSLHLSSIFPSIQKSMKMMECKAKKFLLCISLILFETSFHYQTKHNKIVLPPLFLHFVSIQTHTNRTVFRIPRMICYIKTHRKPFFFFFLFSIKAKWSNYSRQTFIDFLNSYESKVQ